MQTVETSKPVIPLNRLLRCGLVVLSVLLFFGRLGERSLWSMEVRWGEIPREMLERGDFLTPTINGHLYYDKPLGSYWLVLAASVMTGGVNETAARLPSAIAALVAVLLIARMGRRLFDERTGLLAGLILATSFSFAGFARTASADMENVAGILIALTLFLEGGAQPRAWRIIALWLVMALTSLTKGLLGFALPILVIGIECLVAGIGERKRWLLHWATPFGIVLACALYFAPFLMATDRSIAGSGLGMVFRENLQRFIAPHNHKGPIYLYLYTIFGLLAPWSALLPAAFLEGFRRPEQDSTAAGRRFILIFFCATFAFFTLSASRRSYYLLPVLPAAALLIARLLAVGSEELSRAGRVAMRLGFAAVAIGVGISGIALLPARWILHGPLAALPELPAATIFALVWLGCLVAVGFSMRRFVPRRVALSVGVIATLSMGYLNLVAIPLAESYRGHRAFAERIRETIGDDDSQLALYRNREIVYYLRPPHDIREFTDEAAMADAVRHGDVRWAIVHERDVGKLGVACETIAREPSQPWDADAAGARSVLVAFRGSARN